MAFTSEQLDDYPLCGAHKKDGSNCRMFAGAGTTHKGMGRCKWHLGNTASHRQHAVKQEAMQQMATMGAHPGGIKVTPAQALQGALNLSASGLAWLTAMVGALEQDEMLTPEGQSLIRLFNDEKDRLARIAKAASDSGLGERQLQLAERHTQLMSALLEAVMDRIQLTADQRKAVGPAIREALPALMAAEGVETALDEGSADASVAGDAVLV
jgi:hypothetical protein